MKASQNAPKSEYWVVSRTTGPKSALWIIAAIIQPPTEKSRKPNSSANVNAGTGQKNRGFP